MLTLVNLNAVKVGLFLSLLLTSLVAIAAPIALTPYQIHIQNPNKNANYIVGDQFTRVIELEVKAPYKLAKSTLPVKGLSVKGLELNEVKLIEKQLSGSTHYKLILDYQIFTSSAFVKKITLPAQTLKIVNAGRSINIVISAWALRISPIATHSETYIEQDMSPYRSPLLVSMPYLKPILAAFLGMTLLSLLGLIYINADRSWFPGLGGPFAASYRHIISLDQDKQYIQKAVASIHQAFNQTFGESLFEYELDNFLQQHPAFTAIKLEIINFFAFSNRVLFGDKRELPATNTLVHLLKFCEQCRHCERGLLLPKSASATQ